MRRISASGLASTSCSSAGSAPAGKSVSTSPAAPAACASATNRSRPYAITGFTYVMITTGMPSAARPISSSTRGTVIPASRAACVERWIVGPSASGSLNGTPTSTKSAPAAWTSWSAASDASGLGWPAVRYGMSAARRRSPARRVRQRAAIGCSDKVIADVDAVLDRIGDLDDGAGEVALRVALRQVGEKPWLGRRPLGRRHDAHHGTVDVGDVRVGAVDDGDLVGVEDDACAHGIDADQVDERFDDDRIVTAARVFPHLLEHLVGLDRHGLIHAPEIGRASCRERVEISEV